MNPIHSLPSESGSHPCLHCCAINNLSAFSSSQLTILSFQQQQVWLLPPKRRRHFSDCRSSAAAFALQVTPDWSPSSSFPLLLDSPPPPLSSWRLCLPSLPCLLLSSFGMVRIVRTIKYYFDLSRTHFLGSFSTLRRPLTVHTLLPLLLAIICYIDLKGTSTLRCKRCSSLIAIHGHVGIYLLARLHAF